MRLRNLVGIVRGRSRIILITAVVTCLVALGVSFITPAAYQGRATVMLTQQNMGTELLGAPQAYKSDMALQRDVQTQVNVMRSPVILERVIEALKLNTTPTILATKVSIKFDGETNIVTIDATDASAQKAADIANGIAVSYAAWSREQQQSSIRAAVADVEQRLTAAQKQIADAQTAIAAGDRSGTRQAQLQAADSLYASLSDKLAQLQINEQLSTGAGSLLDSASPNPVPVSPKPLRNGALGLALGLVLGLGVALVVETLDNTIKTAEQAKETYDAPVLCAIPMEERQKHAGSASLALVDNPGGPEAEAYRVLRNNIGFINFEHDIKTVLVTSALPQEGKSTVAAGLAAVLARAGKTVVLVCCDFYQPGSARFFNVSSKFGLSDVLSGNIGVSGVMEQAKGFEGVTVIPSGSMPPNPSEMLSSTAMEKLVTDLRETADWVILDSAPLLVVADAAAVARWVDGVLIVSQAHVSTREAARRSRDMLENVGARILGVALWGVEETVTSGGYSYYGATGDRK